MRSDNPTDILHHLSHDEPAVANISPMGIINEELTSYERRMRERPPLAPAPTPCSTSSLKHHYLELLGMREDSLGLHLLEDALYIDNDPLFAGGRSSSSSCLSSVSLVPCVCSQKPPQTQDDESDDKSDDDEPPETQCSPEDTAEDNVPEGEESDDYELLKQPNFSSAFKLPTAAEKAGWHKKTIRQIDNILADEEAKEERRRLSAERRQRFVEEIQRSVEGGVLSFETPPPAKKMRHEDKSLNPSTASMKPARLPPVTCSLQTPN